MNVKTSPWAEGSSQSYDCIASAIPDALNTEFELWQLRVDRKSTTPHMSHSHLFPITAMRYSSQTRSDGLNVFAPVEPNHELTFLVTAENYREAGKKVTAQLVAHGYQAHEWAMRFNRSILVLS